MDRRRTVYSRRLWLVIAVLFLAAPVWSQTIRTITPGQTTSGVLGKADDRLDDGSYYHIYRLPGRRGDQFTVSLTSDRFDTYLIVIDDDNFEEHNDDRTEGDTNSEVSFTADRVRDYYVLVTTYQPGDAGEYSLRVTRVAGQVVSPNPTLQDAQTAAAGGLERSGRLDQQDSMLSSGEYYESHTFTGREGDVVSVAVSSDDFDTYLMLIGPDGSQSENDDSRGSTDSYLERVLEADGEYEVLVTSYEAGETGSYRLTVSSSPLAVSREADQQVTMRTYEGNLRPTVETLAQGEYVHRYEFEAAAGESIDFELASEEFDAYLILEDQYGTWIEQNDDKDESSYDSRISLILPRAGSYQLLVTTYAGGETGRYVLTSTKRFTEVPDVTTITDGRPVRPTPSVDHGYFGVFVGISDYPGRENDLDFCADDATELHDVFLNNGFGVSERLTLLTDRQATTDGMLGAIRSYASQVGEQDTLVIFYSGHGDSVRSTSERDGSDETLELYDGSIRDDELARALDDVRGRVILVVDACYSAGLAKDVITRPGWFGIFSSEEDVVSYVADEFRAGGYLSHFFQEAIAGAADGSVGSAPDGRVSMAELERYLLTAWYGPGGPPADSNQHLRFERNGVSVTEVLFRL